VDASDIEKMAAAMRASGIAKISFRQTLGEAINYIELEAHPRGPVLRAATNGFPAYDRSRDITAPVEEVIREEQEKLDEAAEDDLLFASVRT
jgi:hypothetical protein